MATNVDPNLFLPDDDFLIDQALSDFQTPEPSIEVSTDAVVQEAVAPEVNTPTLNNEPPSTEINQPDRPIPTTDQEWKSVVDNVDAMQRKMALISGRHESLVEREIARVKEVSEAKGRASFKPEVDEILDTLQREAHQRSVGSFESMLTAIARDVQPGSPIEIKLELTTERNMPALDIFAEVHGKPENITSGALNNVVSTGLRFITLARSGRRRFLVLDESDCWIENNDVQNFFNVVSQLSTAAGIQTLIITHHDLSAFQEDFRIYKINEIESSDPWPARLPDLISAGKMNISELQDNVLSFIDLTNFEAYPKAHIELSPSVTAIVGKNRGAKSTWARALRAAFMGESNDTNVRHDQSATKVAIGFSDGRVLEHNRRIKGASKADYILHTADSWAHAKQNPQWAKDPSAPPTLHHSPTARLPEWVPVDTGIGDVDGINVQLWGQLTPVFMLDQPPSKKASLLSIGRESGYLFAMNDLYKDDVLKDNRTIRDGEKEILTLRSELAQYEGVEALKSAVENLSSQLQELQKERQWLQEAERLASQIEQASNDIAHYGAWKALSVPAHPTMDATESIEQWLQQVALAKNAMGLRTDAAVPDLPNIEPTTALSEWLVAMQTAKTDAALYGRVPEMVSMPSLEPTSELQTLVEGLSKADHDRQLPIVRMPEIEKLMRTDRLQEWCLSVDKAKMDMALPMVTIPVMPGILDTRPIEDVLNDMKRVKIALHQCQSKGEDLLAHFKQAQSILERASKNLGVGVFELPEDVAQAMAKGAVDFTQPNGQSKDKVVAYFSKIMEQLQMAAREGFAQGVSKTLNLPEHMLSTTHLNEDNDLAEPVNRKAHKP